MSVDPERTRRIINAVLENMRNWEERLADIERNCSVGNKVRALALLRDMEFARRSLCRLARMQDEPACQMPTDEKPPET